MKPFSVVNDELVHQGAVVGFYRRQIAGPGGEIYNRDVVKHPGAVAVVAYDEGDVYLVKQYRAPLDADLIEIPAGKLDVDGEPLEVTANRELEEEVGRSARKLEPLLDLYHSAGFCDELGHLFLATELVEVPQRLEGPEEAHLEVLKVPMSEAITMVMDGRIRDAKSMVGILAAARQLGY